MRDYIFIMLFLAILTPGVRLVDSKNDKGLLSRRKRYAVFPEGSTWSIAICSMTQTIMPAQVWTEAINWGISYYLPNDSMNFENMFFPQFEQRRSRRDLYTRIETVMESMGFDGRSCIYRSLCEASRKLAPRGNSLSEEILRIIFQYPLKKLLPSEPEEHRLYHRAARIGKNEKEEECSELYPKCPISLLDVALSGILGF